MQDQVIYKWALELLERIERKMPSAIQQAEKLDCIPYTVKEGKYCSGPIDGIAWWTNGFWPSLMWRLYDITGNSKYMDEARRAQSMLDDAFRDFFSLHHDVGFMWRISTGFDYELTGNMDAMKRTMLAANLLAGRFNPCGFIRAWNDDYVGWSIIDSMMNLSLLYWASEQTGDPRFSIIAKTHADTTLKYFIREDGTSEHIVAFDPNTGEVLDKPGGQGYSRGSTWSRGLAWAMYGFAISFSHTQKHIYLDTACKAADAFINLLDESSLPPCDFTAPKEPQIYDDCAGSIAACALLELSEILSKLNMPFDKYRSSAILILHALTEKHVNWDLDFPALLTHCTGAYHSNDHEIPMIYGDYFLVEALCYLCDYRKLRW